MGVNLEKGRCEIVLTVGLGHEKTCRRFLGWWLLELTQRAAP